MTSSNAASTISSDRMIATESAAAASSQENMKQRLEELLDFPPPLGDIRDYLTQQARNSDDGDGSTEQLKEALLSTNFLHHFIGLLDEAEGDDDLALVTEIVTLILDVCPDCVHTVLKTDDDDDYYRNTFPLHIACYNGDCSPPIISKVINLLLDKCSNDKNGGLDHIATFGCCDSVLECYDNVGGCPLSYYITWGGDDMEIVRRMVDLCPASLTLSCDKTKMTPLHIILRSIYEKEYTADVVKLFVETDLTCATLADVYGCYPLHCLSSSVHVECQDQDVVEYMIKLDPSILQIRDVGGCLPIHKACANGGMTLPVLQMLVKFWPESVFETFDGCLPLHILCMNSIRNGFQDTSLDDSTATELLAFLLKKNPESMSVRDPDGDLPIKMAASCQGPQFCKFLIESLPNQDREEILETQELLLVACRRGLPETVQYFVQLFGPECLRIRSPAVIIETNQIQIYEMAPIHAAMMNDWYSADITRMLLKLDPTLASFKMTATVGHPDRAPYVLPLHFHLGCSDSSMDVVQMLFDAYPGAILVSDSKGDDASTLIRKVILSLDEANKWKEKRIQKILDFVEKQKEYCTLARQGDEHLTTPDEHGRLLLHKALADKGVSLGTITMIVGKQDTAARVADNDGLYPLHIASMYCTVDILCHVLGFDKSAVNKVDNEGNNIQHAACKTGNLKVVEYIIDRHGSLASKANNKGQLPIVTLLDKDEKEGNITKTAEYTGMIMKMLLAYPEFVVPAIEC